MAGGLAVTFTPEQVMLTLAGLAYRGFHDLLPGEPHAVVVRRAVQGGLDTLAPVRGEWELVWGPVTSRLPLGVVFDSNAMYVVRNRQARHRYVVALRGTHPISSSDWLFGDLLVRRTVRWPFATDGAAISVSTALGLTELQAMRARLACYSFAGPTAGNAAFVGQLDARLGARQRHVRNAHDLVAQVWEADGLRRVPGVFGPRTAPLGPVMAEVFGSVPALGYRHAHVGASVFAGRLDPHLPLSLELIHQHMEAYLTALGLREHGISAVDFFI